jgi:lysophospholipase L1-like esterase
MFDGMQTTYKIQYAERTSLFESVPTTHADVVFLGDSITQNGLWNELFPGVSLASRGIRGDITSGILKRIDNVIKLHPQKVFLMVGVNDLHRRESQDEILSNYKKIVDRLSTELPDSRIYIQSVLPVRENLKGLKNKDIDSLNHKLKLLADGKNIIYLDINSKLKSQNDELPPKYTVDGEHLKGDAYNIWVGVIKEFVYDQQKNNDGDNLRMDDNNIND